jgi:hypothetical protein
MILLRTLVVPFDEMIRPCSDWFLMEIDRCNVFVKNCAKL